MKALFEEKTYLVEPFSKKRVIFYRNGNFIEISEQRDNERVVYLAKFNLAKKILNDYFKRGYVLVLEGEL